MMYKICISLTVLILLGWYFRSYVTAVGTAFYFKTPYPKFQVIVDRQTSQPMTDGVELIADVYRPDYSGKFPAIIVRTPYGRDNKGHHYELIAKLFAAQGFIFVIQDVRGRSPSQGEFYPHKYEAQDGAQTLDWVVRQPYCDGQAALFGFSYFGLTAWQAAGSSTHKIATVMPWFTGSNPYPLWYDQGVPYLKQFVFWMMTYGGCGSKKITHSDVDAVIQNIADVKNADVLLTGQVIPAYQDFLAHPSFDDFWKSFSTSASSMDQDIPMLLGGGWFDQFLTATIQDFKELKKSPSGSKRAQSRLILGPWMHSPSQAIDGMHFGSDASFIRQFATMIQWCRKWMLDDQSVQMPPVTYYLMGENRWQTSSDWPPPEAEGLALYLDVQKSQLVASAPKQGERLYTYDPCRFVPSIGVRRLYSGEAQRSQDASSLRANRDALLDALLDVPLDVLLWNSDSLDHSMAVVGAPKLHLCVSDTPKSFDIAVKLIDLFPDGKMQLITEGYRRISRKETQVPYSIEVSMADTAYVIPAGHRLQIAIAHSDFPGHEPNISLLQTSQAHITLHSGASLYLELLNLPIKLTY